MTFLTFSKQHIFSCKRLQALTCQKMATILWGLEITHLPHLKFAEKHFYPSLNMQMQMQITETRKIYITLQVGLPRAGFEKLSL